MKKYLYIIPLSTAICLTACEGDAQKTENNTEQNDSTATTELKNFEELDLNQWGFNMSIMIPDAASSGDPEVKLTERGALEVKVGQGFGVEIMYGEGDIELLKMDLNEDLVFKSEIVKEEPNGIIYKQTIPGSGVDTQNHFFYKQQIGTDIYEIRDIMEYDYGMGMVEKMFEAAKTLKEKKAEATV